MLEGREVEKKVEWGGEWWSEWKDVKRGWQGRGWEIFSSDASAVWHVSKTSKWSCLCGAASQQIVIMNMSQMKPHAWWYVVVVEGRCCWYTQLFRYNSSAYPTKFESLRRSLVSKVIWRSPHFSRYSNCASSTRLYHSHIFSCFSSALGSQNHEEVQNPNLGMSDKICLIVSCTKMNCFPIFYEHVCMFWRNPAERYMERKSRHISLFPCCTEILKTFEVCQKK